MRKKSWKQVAAIVICAALLSGCTGENGQKKNTGRKEGQVVNIYCWNDEFKEIYDKYASDLAFKFQNKTLGRLFTDAGHSRQKRAFLLGDGLSQSIDRHAGKNGQSSAGADAGNFDELSESGALLCRAETVEQLGIFAHDEMREQRDFLSDVRKVVEGGHRNVDFIADAVDVDQNFRRIFFKKRAANASDHD